MNGEKADMVFTDPPYGVNYDGGHATDKRREKLKNDNSTLIYDDSVPNMFRHSKDEAALYLWFAATKSLQVLQVLQVLQANNYVIRSWLIWNKNQAQFGAIGAQYKQKHEPCLYCFKKGQSPYWNGPNNEVSVWDEKRSRINEFHPTQKPVELSARALANSCPASGLVLDLFLGSGATLIGAEQTKRKCYGMEISPNYCDVIVKRWENLTGKKATLAK
jgi:DNA modification methylase